MDPFTIAMLALSAIPRLIEGYEVLFTNKRKSGRRKKKLLMDTTKAGLALAKVKPDQQAMILEAVSALTDATVKEMNAAPSKSKPK